MFLIDAERSARRDMILCNLRSLSGLERANSESQVEEDGSERAAVNALETWAMTVR